MAAGCALVAMTAEGRGAAADDRIEYFTVRPTQDANCAAPKTVARCADEVGHLDDGPILASSASGSASRHQGGCPNEKPRQGGDHEPPNIDSIGRHRRLRIRIVDLIGFQEGFKSDQ
jgi:hypothetical protein